MEDDSGFGPLIILFIFLFLWIFVFSNNSSNNRTYIRTDQFETKIESNFPIEIKRDKDGRIISCGSGGITTQPSDANNPESEK